MPVRYVGRPGETAKAVGADLARSLARKHPGTRWTYVPGSEANLDVASLVDGAAPSSDRERRDRAA
jgi:hypothetical protein